MYYGHSDCQMIVNGYYSKKNKTIYPEALCQKHIKVRVPGATIARKNTCGVFLKLILSLIRGI